MKKVKEEIECLKYLYDQILMEKDTYSLVIKKYKELENNNEKNEAINIDFMNFIRECVTEFNKFLKSIKIMLKNRNYDKNQDDLAFRVATYFSIDIKNSNEFEIVRQLIHGSEVVLNNLDKYYRNLEITSKTIENLIERFINFEKNVVINLKKYNN